MKRFFTFCIWAFAVAFVSCKEEGTEQQADWFGEPQVSAVSGTAAEVACLSVFADGVLTPENSGFSYAPLDESGVPGAFTDVRPDLIDGGLIRVRLTGLLPSTDYTVNAFVALGSSRMTSKAVTFTTSDVAPGETVLEIVSLTTLTVDAGGDVCTIAYSVVNPQEGAAVEASCPAEWIDTFDYSIDGEISFLVDGNTGDERSAVVTVAYPGAEPRTVTVVQRAGGSVAPPQPDTETVLLLEASTEGWPSSYQDTSLTLDGHKFAVKDVAVFGSNAFIQFKKTSGYLANVDDMGPVRRIEVVYESGTANLQLYLGDQAKPHLSGSMQAVPSAADTQVVPQEIDGTYVFDCAAYAYPYFSLVNGDGVSRVKSLKIVCGGSGDTPTPLVKPEFGTPSSSSVTKNGAVVSCSFRYAGSGTVTEAYFAYTTDGVASRRVDVTTAQGAKTAQLSGLQAATRYTFRLCVVVDGALSVSSDASFTTLDEQGGIVTGDTKFPGWPELIPEDAAKAGDEYYYAYHICPDFTVNGYKARNYTVCFSATHHCPVWVAAPRHACYEGSASRSDAYAADPDIPANLQYYSKSTDSGCNKGHMLGSAERTKSTAINRQVFYYSNIAPQYSSGFNTGGGGWNTLEDWIDGKVCADTTYLVIGTYFEAFTDGYGKSASPKKISFGGRSDVSCPTMFYIAALRTKKGTTGKSVQNCTADELMCAAFVRAHTNDLKGQAVTSREMMSIADLEKLTGHRFFVNVPNAPKSSYTPSDWGL